MKRPPIRLDGEPDHVARIRAMFQRAPYKPTWQERWALRWRIWAGDGAVAVCMPLLALMLLAMLLAIWLLGD